MKRRPFGMVGYGSEYPTSQLHTCLEGKAMEEIGNFLEGGGGRLRGGHEVVVSGFGSRCFTRAAVFFFGFSAAGLGHAVNLGSSFLGIAVFFVAINLNCSGDLVTR